MDHTPMLPHMLKLHWLFAIIWASSKSVHHKNLALNQLHSSIPNSRREGAPAICLVDTHSLSTKGLKIGC